MLVAVQVLQEGEEAPKGCGVYVVNDAMTVCLDLEGIVDPQKEAEKLQAKQVAAHILYGVLSQPLTMVESADLCVHMVNAYAGKHPSRPTCVSCRWLPCAHHAAPCLVYIITVLSLLL